MEEIEGEHHRSVACILMIPTHQIYYRLIEERRTYNLLSQFELAGLGFGFDARFLISQLTVYLTESIQRV